MNVWAYGLGAAPGTLDPKRIMPGYGEAYIGGALGAYGDGGARMSEYSFAKPLSFSSSDAGSSYSGGFGLSDSSGRDGSDSVGGV